jgi:hypothetical protein
MNKYIIDIIKKTHRNGISIANSYKSLLMRINKLV